VPSTKPPSRYRIAVWGPGTLGSGCIRQILRRPELELASVLAYSRDKAGVDAGTAIGLAPCGVAMAADRREFLACHADVVLYCARDIDDDASLSDLLELLQAGFNVITPQAFHTFEDRGSQVRDSIETACTEGGSTFFATGISPGFVVERLMTTLTGVASEIDSIVVDEVFNAELLGPEFLAEYGFGFDRESAERRTWGARDDPHPPHAARYLGEQIPLAAEALGIDVDRIERQSTYDLAEADIELKGGRVRAGTVARACHAWIGYVADHPFVTYRCWWFLTHAMRPPGMTEDFIVSIEGRPSLRLGLDITASLGSRKRRYPDDPTTAGYYATLAPMVLAIPDVVAHRSGIMTTPTPPLHWRPNLSPQQALR
jgi:4-hydroxy-tetrahydrodipicolinate reductase